MNLAFRLKQMDGSLAEEVSPAGAKLLQASCCSQARRELAWRSTTMTRSCRCRSPPSLLTGTLRLTVSLLFHTIFPKTPPFRQANFWFRISTPPPLPGKELPSSPSTRAAERPACSSKATLRSDLHSL